MAQRTVATSVPQGMISAAGIAAIQAAIQTGGSITASDIQSIVNAVNAFASHYHVVNDYAFIAYGNLGYATSISDHNTAAVTGFATYWSPIGPGYEIYASDVNNLKAWVNALKTAHNHQVTDN